MRQKLFSIMRDFLPFPEHLRLLTGKRDTSGGPQVWFGRSLQSNFSKVSSKRYQRFSCELQVIWECNHKKSCLGKQVKSKNTAQFFKLLKAKSTSTINAKMTTVICRILNVCRQNNVNSPNPHSNHKHLLRTCRPLLHGVVVQHSTVCLMVMRK